MKLFNWKMFVVELSFGKGRRDQPTSGSASVAPPAPTPVSRSNAARVIGARPEDRKSRGRQSTILSGAFDDDKSTKKTKLGS